MVAKRGEMNMNLRIENISDCQIAYFRQTGPYGERNKEVMEKLKNWAGARNLLKEESIIVGIAQDNPELTQPESCRYDVGLVIKDENKVEGTEVRIGNIADGRYAVVQIEHTSEAVQHAWMEIFPEISQKGYQLDGTRPIVERYKAELINKHCCEICVPVL